MTTEQGIVDRINALVEEEHRLRGSGEGLDDDARTRIDQLEVELDRCWDLLRQRRARAEFGANPDEATPRDAETVEGYIQ